MIIDTAALGLYPDAFISQMKNISKKPHRDAVEIHLTTHISRRVPAFHFISSKQRWVFIALHVNYKDKKVEITGEISNRERK